MTTFCVAHTVVSSETSTGQKPSKYKSGSRDTSKAAKLDETSVIIVGRIPLIFSLIETILLIKNLMKSSLLRVKGIHGNRARTLCQPGYSAEEKPGIILILFYQ